jgi:hypothetical protein
VVPGDGAHELVAPKAYIYIDQPTKEAYMPRHRSITSPPPLQMLFSLEPCSVTESNYFQVFKITKMLKKHIPTPNTYTFFVNFF